jgi:hypothetical protein
MGYGPGVPGAPAYGLMGPTEVIVDMAQIYDGDRCRVGRGQRLPVKVLGRSLSVPMSVPPRGGVELKHEKRLDRLRPAQVLVYQLPLLLDRDNLFSSAEAIAHKLGLRGAKRLFQADDFFQVGQSQPLTKSPDLVVMARAAGEACAPGALPGPRSGDLRFWLDKVLAQQPAADVREWPEG